MHRKCSILLALLLMLSAGLGLAEDAGENLLVNGGFEQVTGDQPDGWAKDMWVHDVGVTYMEVREGREGGHSAMIENVAINDARFVQTVAVQPDTLYHFSGWVMAEDIGLEGAGASLSVINTYASFPAVHDTDGEWVYLDCYLRTGENQREITVGPRLGDYSADNSGKAFFDDLSLVSVDALPPGASEIPLVDYASLPQSQDGLVMAETSTGAASQVLTGLALFAVALLLLWMLRMRGVPRPDVLIWLLLAVAALLRLYLMATNPGYESDMSCFFSWSSRMAEVGPGAFYAPDYFCDYPPGYMYLLWATGGLMNLFGAGHATELGRVIVKLMPMLADLAAVLLIYRLGRNRLGEGKALLLAALYAISPAILVDSAIWGQVDAVLALGLLGTVALATGGRWMAALPVFAVTVLMKPQALMAAPIGLVALALDILPWKAGGKRAARDAALGLVIAAGVAVAMLVPFLWGKEAPVAWLINQYSTTLGSYSYATLNALNVYYLFGLNWVPLEQMLGPLTYGTWGTILMVIVVAGVMFAYGWRGDRERIALGCALIYIGLYLLGVKMHERYLFPAFLLLLYAYIRRPDWRLLAAFLGFSITFYINCRWVLEVTHLPLGFHLGGAALSLINLLLGGLVVWAMLDPRARPLPAARRPEPVDRLAAFLPEGAADAAAPLAALPRPDAEGGPGEEAAPPFGPTPPPHRLKGRDWALMLGLTVVYALIAFIGLGSITAPQTVWTSTGAQEEVVFDLGESREFNMLYYGGINSRDFVFDVAFSDDGQTWYDETPLSLKPGDCFHWLFATAPLYDGFGTPTSWEEAPLLLSGRYIRLTAPGPAMTLMEVAFHDVQGTPIAARDVTSTGARAESASDPWHLADEPLTAPDYPSYYNGTYFDEIYHARTGYEHAHAMSTYEYTHPPLGKVFIMWGIQLFGMVPFGWRFMGTLAGVLMVPAMYLLGKLIFKKSRYAFLAAFLMAFDMMHLTQTRIATIDSYAVLFILLMYYCMFRYMRMSFFRDGFKTLIPLGLSGLFMGLGIASKWICIYAGAGLAVLFFWTVIQRFLEWRSAQAAGGAWAQRAAAFPKYLIGTLAACVVFFIAIPLIIYYVSYIPHMAYEGGITIQRVWDTQKSIFDYHANLVDDHAFKSPWYEWPLMLKPMYYFRGTQYVPDGMASTIMCMGNPAVWWVGLITFVFLFWRWLRPNLRGERVTDHRPALLLVSFAAQFLPWVLVPRSTFIYHYFGSLPFVMLSIVYAFEALQKRFPRGAGIAQAAYMAVVAGLFVAFYPVATGVPVQESWIRAVNWLGFLYLPGWKHRGWIYS